MKLLVGLLLIACASAQAPEKREYFPVPVAKMPANHHTHVQVTGKVTLVRKEGDGDTHIRLEDGGAFIVAECIPKLPCQVPKVGQTVTVKGISRFDGEHKWTECHPVEELTIQ